MDVVQIFSVTVYNKKISRVVETMNDFVSQRDYDKWLEHTSYSNILMCIIDFDVL